MRDFCKRHASCLRTVGEVREQSSNSLVPGLVQSASRGNYCDELQLNLAQDQGER
jgi:hypothetical protein